MLRIGTVLDREDRPRLHTKIPSPKWGEGYLVLLICLADILQSGDKVIQNLGRHHDAVAIRAHFFGDANHSSSCIALQVDEERLAIGNNFFCADNIVVHCK